MGKPRSVWRGFAVVVKVTGPVGGEGTHKHTHARRRPVANDTSLLFSREERVMVKMKEEIDGTVCVSIRLSVMSSALHLGFIFFPFRKRDTKVDILSYSSYIKNTLDKA